MISRSVQSVTIITSPAEFPLVARGKKPRIPPLAVTYSFLIHSSCLSHGGLLRPCLQLHMRDGHTRKPFASAASNATGSLDFDRASAAVITLSKAMYSNPLCVSTRRTSLSAVSAYPCGAPRYRFNGAQHLFWNDLRELQRPSRLLSQVTHRSSHGSVDHRRLCRPRQRQYAAEDPTNESRSECIRTGAECSSLPFSLPKRNAMVERTFRVQNRILWGRFPEELEHQQGGVFRPCPSAMCDSSHESRPVT